MSKAVFAIPGNIDTPTGGYSYDRRVMPLIGADGVEIAHLQLPGGFPFPSPAELDETARLLAGVPADTVLLVDGLAFGAMPAARIAGIAAPIVVLLHHPLGLETGLSEAASRELLATEKAALRFARRIAVTSRATAKTLRDLAFAPPPPVTIAEPGTDPAPRARGSEGAPEIISVGAVIPRKGHDVLIEALAGLTGLEWRCTIAGSLDRDSNFAATLFRRVAEAGLESRVRFTGALSTSELDAHYGRADIFALPSRYEGYGMVFAEALARGLPVVAARAGAVPETVPGEAGLLVPVDDAGSLRDALGSLITDTALRRRISDAAWEHGQRLPRWEDTARKIADLLKEAGR